MRKYTIAVLAILGSILFTGCYHAQITTGMEPSAEVYEQTFASSWIYGLVPPSVVEAQNHCRNGVARVETRLSFVNQLVGMLSFGIYTPMHIKVTCASSRADIPTDRSTMYTINSDDSEDVISSTLSKAVEKSLKDSEPFYLEMK
ncbi:MAG: hypothetical protein EA390_09090 [Balneolaceae bacterium]|nr:MAG: hypothetical protein EA390_09090 [Balneolaceae bacterium]